jgi:hypothetical protein
MRIIASLGPAFLLSLGTGLAAAGVETSLGSGDQSKTMAFAVACLFMLASGAWWFVKREMEKLNKLPSEEWYKRVSKMLDDFPIVCQQVDNLEGARREHREDEIRNSGRIDNDIARVQRRVEVLSDVLRGRIRPEPET